ncbi:MAG: sensor histidine kinase [Bacteroidales bacterium]
MTLKKLPVALMLFSLVLLIVLQALWLRTEYRSSVDAFSRETQMVFRSTLHQLSDSIFSRSFLEIPESLEGDTARKNQVRQWSTSPGNIRHISIVDLGRNDSIAATNDTIPITTRQMTLTFQNPENPDDSLRISRRFRTHPQDVRWMLTPETYGYNKDSIEVYYRRNLNASLARLPFTILEKDYVPQARPTYASTADTLPFTTAWVPFARKMYAADFSTGSWFLRRKLLPQAGFAAITTMLIFTSFLMVWRSMRAREKLMEQKDDFIGNITHELKTPLASAGVALEAISNFDVLQDQNKTREYLLQARHELHRLEVMTEKILRTSVMDYAGEILQHSSRLDLSSLTHEALDTLQMLARSKGIELVLESRGSAHIKGHPDHLTQMICNLADNAIKYAAEGKKVTFQIAELPQYIILEVTDHGPGIAAEHHARIFEKFYRIPTGNVHNVKGYGLGLHYVAEVVKLHQGRITLDSQPGKGCRFIIKLPRN